MTVYRQNYVGTRAEASPGSTETTRSAEGLYGLRPLGEWLDRQVLRPWLVSPDAWERWRHDAARRVQVQSAPGALALVAGQQVAAASPERVRGGPHDGAPGVELIFASGLVMWLPVAEVD